MARGDRDATLGFNAYSRMMQTLRQKAPSHDDFERSRYYLAFVRFGRRMLDIDASRPTLFLDWLLSKEIPLDRWCENGIYDTYLRERNKVETPDAAAERTVLLMQSWAEETGQPWQDFFRLIEPVRAVRWIMSGRISPWALYTAPSAEALLNRLSDEQVTLVSSALDPAFWNIRLDKHPEEVGRLRAIFAEFGA